MAKNEGHRPGLFKQTNKSHKTGRHRSKNSISADAKGKASVKSLTKKHKPELNRDARRNQANQLRQNKREEILAEKRSIGSAPLLVAVVPLNGCTDAEKVVKQLIQCHEDTEVTKSPTGVFHIYVPSLKKRFAFIVPNAFCDTFGTLDALKVADTVLFLVSTQESHTDEQALVDEWGRRILSEACGQGVPTPFVSLVDTDTVPIKKLKACVTRVNNLVSKWVSGSETVAVGSVSDCKAALRKMGDQKQWKVHYRDKRPYFLGDRAEFVPEHGSKGTLKISGYLRGDTFSADHLVHLPGLGDFQLSAIEELTDPYAFLKTMRKKNGAVQEEVKVIRTELPSPDRQESLDAECSPDGEMADVEMNNAEQMSEDEEDESEAGPIQSKYAEAAEGSDSEELEDALSNLDEEPEVIDDTAYDKAHNKTEEMREYAEWCQKRRDDEDYYKRYPDEVDTPTDVLAKDRFSKYRGLESFKKSRWNRNDSLPSDYARIYKCERYRARNKLIWKEQSEVVGVETGVYVRASIKDVSQMLWEAFEKTGDPLVLIGLVRHEHKMSIVNVTLERTAAYQEPIASKDRLVFQCGFRRFINHPIFSEHTPADKYKLVKYLYHGGPSVATFYGRIQFLPAPVLCYKEVAGSYVLVAKGGLLNCDPGRVILKKIVLNGRLLRSYKKSAVVRFMFFDREDIEFYKPIKLLTRPSGIRGEILGPVGTHGHMKCSFKDKPSSEDIFTLNLFKRVFPKWMYEELYTTGPDNDVKMD